MSDDTKQPSPPPSLISLTIKTPSIAKISVDSVHDDKITKNDNDSSPSQTVAELTVSGTSSIHSATAINATNSLNSGAGDTPSSRPTFVRRTPTFNTRRQTTTFKKVR